MEGELGLGWLGLGNSLTKFICELWFVYKINHYRHGNGEEVA